jgi:SAM-dependent methyltransferase
MPEQPFSIRTVTKAAFRRISGFDVSEPLALWRDLQRKLDHVIDQLDRLSADVAWLKRHARGETDPVGQGLPPKHLMDLVGGASSFHVAGAVMFNHLQQIARLKPNESVLDVGCGVGRTARHLTSYLTPEGKYRGFDIVLDSILWNQQNISSKFPHFQFSHADIFNGRYNPKGKARSTEFRFPYEDGSFDVAFLDSVFTHMYADDVAHYLREIHRVLKPGGRVLASFFWLDDTSRGVMTKPGSQFNFAYPGDGSFTAAPDCPEDAIAFDLAAVKQMLERTGLRITELHPGNWSSRPDGGQHQQDLVLAVK